MGETVQSAAGGLRARLSRFNLTGQVLALAAMIIVQTVVIGFDYASVGEWFATWSANWVNILRNNAIVGIISLGMTFVIITGGIDLAVGSTLVGVGTIAMVLFDTGPAGVLGGLGIEGWPAILIGMAAAILAGMAMGCLNGLLVTKGRIPPFIVTLGMMNIIRSVVQCFMQARSAPIVPDEFKALANSLIGTQRILPIIYWFALAVIMHIIARHTAFGRHVYAVGSNERTTRLSGINVDRVKILVYTLMGLMVSFAALTETARMGSMNPSNAGSGYELDAIAAVVVGGTSMSGGRGSIVGAVLGMLIIGVMNNLLNLIGVPPFLRNACKGAIVILAVLMQRKRAQAA